MPPYIEVGLGDLVDHEGVVVGRGAAFHLAELGEDVFEGSFVGEVGGRFVELVVPLVAGALVLIPPVAPFFFVGAMELVVPGLEPGLRGVARRCDEAVVEDDAAGGVFGVHGFEDGDGVGVFEVGADFVLQAVDDDAGVRAVGLHHLDAFDEHEALGELVGVVSGLLHDDGVGAGCGVGGEFADGHLAGAGFHVAEEAEAVVGAEDLFLGEVAVEVEAVEV